MMKGMELSRMIEVCSGDPEQLEGIRKVIERQTVGLNQQVSILTHALINLYSIVINFFVDIS
jgi:hypothetical protein